MATATNPTTREILHRWPGDLLALISGALITLSLAPYNLWFFSLLAITVFCWTLRGLSNRSAWCRSFFFGLGMYGSGVSWVYVSIHDFGYTGIPLAIVMTFLFVSFLALVFSLPFYFFQRFMSRSRFGFLLGFPAIWVLGEWLRSWFLTGFPWLYLGYGHIDSWLAGWAPVTGVFGLSFIVVITSAAVASVQQDFENLNKRRYLFSAISLCTVASLWLAGLQLQNHEWTHHTEADKRTVTLVQPNIPLEIKWNPMYRPAILRQLRELTDPHWQSDIIVWPEAAIPLMYHEATDVIEELEQDSKENNTAIISGILYDDTQLMAYYNGIVGMGAADNIYFKQRLVPFGEYVPLEKYLRGLIAFFDLPNSIIHAGPNNQQGITVGDYSIAPYICYEIVYPDLVASNLGDAQLMVTISNDAWFGKSIGPLQHFEMARMRALENGRYLIRGTNTGLSGIFSHKGEIMLQGTPFVAESITGNIYLTRGVTPFTLTGSKPTIALCIFMLLLAIFFQRRQLRVAHLPL